MSQSELYALSLCSDLSTTTENLVIPTIKSDQYFQSSTTPTTTTTRKIFAFSHRRHSRRISASETDIIENRIILNTLQKLVANGSNSISNSNPRKRKRRRKLKEIGEDEEIDDVKLGVISVNGEEIDLDFVADGAFDDKLKEMTDGMVREDEFLGFLGGLEGRWGSTRKRRKYVAAEVFVKALPADWKILLSLRPRARQPSLYCRRFVSPSDVHFKSCKDVAFYLKSEFEKNDANPPNEGPVMQIENDHQATGPETSLAAEEVNLLETSELRIQEPNPLPLTGQTNVPCPIVKNSLEHKAVVVEEELDPLQDIDSVMNHRLKNRSPNGEGSSSVPKSSNELENSSEVTRNLTTRCMWCLDEFSRPPVDAETLASSSGFICPKCKEEISGSLETTLSKFYRHTDK